MKHIRKISEIYSDEDMNRGKDLDKSDLGLELKFKGDYKRDKLSNDCNTITFATVIITLLSTFFKLLKPFDCYNTKTNLLMVSPC